MTRVSLNNISPVHIGSGTQYQGNSEYLYFSQEKVLVVIDEAKILDIIGVENMPVWVGYIEDMEHKKDFLEYLRQRKPNIVPSDIATRIIPLQGDKTPYFSNTFREQIHNGMGLPYIPGSSIKGAIRTALFAYELLQRYQMGGIPDGKLGYYDSKKDRMIFKDKPLQQEVFGRDPNSDWLRLLQVGDCYFKPGSTMAAFSETLNERKWPRYEIKEEVRQLIEYLPRGAESEFTLHIPDPLKALIAKKMPDLFPPYVSSFDIPTLFKVVHAHSLRLLEDEITFFEEAELPNHKSDLLPFLEEIRDNAKEYAKNECLLRLGFGTGYRNMTGHWVKELVLDDELYDEIGAASRRTTRYNGMPLPKSRKIMFDGQFMGYVKLTILN